MTEPITGFFEEAPGVRSSTRLFAGLIVAGVLAVIGTICYVAITKDDPVGVIAALGGTIVPMLGGIWATVRERGGTEPQPKEPAPPPPPEP